MRKTYIAHIDSGRTFYDFVFYSDHRANSTANIEDAKETFKRFKGYRPNVLYTRLASWCDELEGSII